MDFIEINHDALDILITRIFQRAHTETTAMGCRGNRGSRSTRPARSSNAPKPSMPKAWYRRRSSRRRSWIDGFFSFPGISFFCATAFLSAFPASLTAVFSLLRNFVFNFGFSSFEHGLKMNKRTSLSQKGIRKKYGRKSYVMDPWLNMSFESCGISTPFKDLSWNE